MDLELLGVDFSSAPGRRKPIVVARGRLAGGLLRLQRIDEFVTLQAFEDLLAEPGPWLGGFDFPFGLPREFVDTLQLGDSAAAVMAALRRRCPDRAAFRALVDDWGGTRPAGRRLVHRATDVVPDGRRSTSPLQTRYVPVGYMYYEGFARLLAAGVHLPGLHEGDHRRVALEAYPGRVAQALIGSRSYKNSAAADRLIARKDLVDAIEQGRWRGLRIRLAHAQREALVDDAGGDRLDAVLCLLQAAWAAAQPRHGLPAEVDAVEGWIIAS